MNTNDELLVRLNRIYYGLGPYKQDALEHATSVILSLKKEAEICLKLLDLPILPVKSVYDMGVVLDD